MFWYIIITAYMFTGLICLEWAWIQLKQFREQNEERDGRYPAFRRYDFATMQKWKYYFGAMTLMPIRFLISVLMIFVLYLVVK